MSFSKTFPPANARIYFMWGSVADNACTFSICNVHVIWDKYQIIVSSPDKKTDQHIADENLDLHFLLTELSAARNHYLSRPIPMWTKSPQNISWNSPFTGPWGELTRLPSAASQRSSLARERLKVRISISPFVHTKRNRETKAKVVVAWHEWETAWKESKRRGGGGMVRRF
jgi:hypothetical protein